MARTNIIVPFSEVTLTSGDWKTVAAWASAAQQITKALSLKFAGRGVSGDAIPIRFRFAQITAASGTGSSVTPVHTNTNYTFTPRTTARNNFSSQPTLTAATDIYYPDKFHPQGGLVGNFEFHDFLVGPTKEMAVQMFVESAETAIIVSGHVLLEE